MTEIQLGATYKDAVSGFQGVATSTTTFLFACERVYLSAGHKDEDGKEKGAAFDAAQLIKVADPSPEVQAALDAMYASEKAEEPQPAKADESKKDKRRPRTGGDRPMPSMERP